MGIVDVVFLVILFIAFISGMQKGLITSFLACAAMVGALLIAKGLEGTLAKSFEGTSFSSWLYSNFSEAQGALQVDWNNWFHVLSFVIVFILAYAALMLVINLINNVFRIPKLKAVDGLLGGVLGLARGYAVICLIVSASLILFRPLASEGNNFVEELFRGSALGRFFTSGKTISDLFGVGKLITNLK